MISFNITSSTGMSTGSGGVTGPGYLTGYITDFCTDFQFDSGGDTFGGTLGFLGRLELSVSHSSLPQTTTHVFNDLVELPITGSFNSIASTGSGDVQLTVPSDFLPFDDFGFQEPLSAYVSLHIDFTIADDTVMTGSATGSLTVFDSVNVTATMGLRPFSLELGLGCFAATV